MKCTAFPVIDLAATGENILRLRKARGYSVRDLQDFFGFDQPQAIYKWQSGQSLPSVDNLYALGALLEVPIEEILIPRTAESNMNVFEQQAGACCSVFSGCFGYGSGQPAVPSILRMLSAVRSSCGRAGAVMA